MVAVVPGRLTTENNQQRRVQQNWHFSSNPSTTPAGSDIGEHYQKL